jgi:hypothetical protein
MRERYLREQGVRRWEQGVNREESGEVGAGVKE